MVEETVNGSRAAPERQVVDASVPRVQAYDVIIVGSGIAGLSFAIKVAEAGQRVAIITKKDSAESNTNYAQGGIAAVTSQSDDVEMHVADTLDAGDGLCDEAAVRDILQDGPDSIDELMRRGVAFTQLDDGRVSLGKEERTLQAPHSAC